MGSSFGLIVLLNLNNGCSIGVEGSIWERKEAGFKASSVVKAKSFFSNKLASYFKIWESVGHLPTLWFRMARTCCGVLMVSLPPKVSFLLSSFNRVVAATDCMHSGDRVQEAGKEGRWLAASPCSCVRTPRAIPPPPLQINEKVFQRMEEPEQGHPVSASLDP